MYQIDKTIRPIEPDFDDTHLDFVEELLFELELQGNMDRSDAQGFQMIRTDATEYCYNLGMTPEQTANYLLTNEE